MFTHDYTADFDAVLTATEPFALVRFGDGEVKLIAGEPHHSADVWRSKGRTWISAPLEASLRYVADGYCVGLPPQCCMALFATIANGCPVPDRRRTYATLFQHGNLDRIGEIVECYAGACIVSAEYGEARIPADGVTAEWDVDDLVTYLLGVDRPILLAAGPCANVIAHRYWERQSPELRQTIIDVGSALDVAHGRISRYYYNPSDPLRSHRCRWTMGHAVQHAGEETPMQSPVRLGRSTVIRNNGGAAVVQSTPAPSSASRSITVHTKVPRGPCPTCARIRK